MLAVWVPPTTNVCWYGGHRNQNGYSENGQEGTHTSRQHRIYGVKPQTPYFPLYWNNDILQFSFLYNSAFNFILLLQLKSHYKCSNKNPFLIRNVPILSPLSTSLEQLIFLVKQKNSGLHCELIGMLFDLCGRTGNEDHGVILISTTNVLVTCTHYFGV